MLTPTNKPIAAHDISGNYPKLNTEGGTYQVGTHDLVFATESKMVFHWPQADAE